MRVDDRIKKAVVFLGKKTKHGPFVPYGTGFLVRSAIGSHGYQQIVTAKHVIEDINSDVVHVRVNTRSGSAEILDTDTAHWHDHANEDIDLAVCPTMIPMDCYDIMHHRIDDGVLNEKVISDREIGVGDEVFIAGMFVSRLGESRNIPIVRIGNIAAMAEEPIRTDYGYHDAYLIEARSIGGLSGSPVFVHLPIWRHMKDGSVVQLKGMSWYLMGMLLGHDLIANPEDALAIRSEAAPEESEDEEDRLSRLVPLNTGIGIVLPIQYVIEAIEQPEIVEKRMSKLKNASRKTGYVADSAARPAPSTTADNPSHKEDFNRLLDAASKGPLEGVLHG